MKVLSHLHSIMRGSVGGLTYTANPYAQIIGRIRTAPIQPNTAGQQLLKGIMTYLTSRWLDVSAATRAAWEAYAASCLYLGPLGSYTVPGRQMFIATLSVPGYIQQRGFLMMSEVLAAPGVAGWLSAGPFGTTLPAVGTGFGLSIQNPNDFDIVALTFRSIGFTQGRNRYKGPWIYGTAQASIITAETTGLQTFTGLIEGAVYFTHTRCVRREGPYQIVGTPNMIRHVAVTV